MVMIITGGPREGPVTPREANPPPTLLDIAHAGPLVSFQCPLLPKFDNSFSVKILRIVIL